LHPQVAGNLQPRLNTGERPIANKYCEGKMKRTLGRRSKELEVVKRESNRRGARSLRRSRDWKSAESQPYLRVGGPRAEQLGVRCGLVPSGATNPSRLDPS